MKRLPRSRGHYGYLLCLLALCVAALVAACREPQTPARFPAGTLARIDAACVGNEKRSDFIREAVERELERRSK